MGGTHVRERERHRNVCLRVCEREWVRSPSFSNMVRSAGDWSPCLVELDWLGRVYQRLFSGSMMGFVGCYIGQAGNQTVWFNQLFITANLSHAWRYFSFSDWEWKYGYPHSSMGGSQTVILPHQRWKKTDQRRRSRRRRCCSAPGFDPVTAQTRQVYIAVSRCYSITNTFNVFFTVSEQ